MPSLSDILYALRYQILTPQVTTMSKCEVEHCQKSARGGGMCAACRTVQLGELLGNTYTALGYARKLTEAQRLIWDAEDMADEMQEKGK